MKYFLDGESLRIQDAWEIMKNDSVQVQISENSQKNIDISRERVEKILASGTVTYGINTGFGDLARMQISDENLDLLQANLIRSHSVGVGEEFSQDIVRGSLLLRANTLCRGYSGIRRLVVDRILFFLNQGIHPVVPSIGSLGACGDLAPLSHMALCLMGEGEVFYKKERLSALELHHRLNLEPITLKAKEGLALINGTPVMSAVSIKAVSKMENLLKVAEIVSVMTLESLGGTDRAFIEQLHQLRPHKGQLHSASILRKLLEGSVHLASHKTCKKVQDAYSLRCIPQVHGACWDAFFRTKETLEIEINSVTDNPIVLEEDIISGGNFHGEPISMVMCYLAMAACELGSISERRQNRLMNPSLSGLPAFLTENSGLNSGLMIAHYTTAACVSENKVLAHPAVVDSISTSADQEDHVSMGTTSARNCLKIIENLEHVLTIELLMAAQGLDFIKEHRPSEAIFELHREIRKRVDFIDKDRFFKNDMNVLHEMVCNGSVVAIVESVVKSGIWEV